MKYSILSLLTLGLLACGAKQEEVATFIANSIPVTIGTVTQQMSMEQVTTSGLLVTDQTTKYAFKIGGVVDRIYVDEGDRVKKGQLLATISMTEIDAQLNQATLSLTKLQRDYERVENLYRDSIATLEALQDIKTLRDIAQQTLDQVSFNRKYAKVYAATNGFVTKKLANNGEVIAPGTPVLITNDATTQQGWIIDCSVNDQEWASIKVGDLCSVTLNAYADQTINGSVSSKSLLAEPASGALKVAVELQPVKLDLAIGMYGTVRIETGTKTNALVIPFEALVEANGNEGYVFVPTSDTSIVRRKIVVKSFDASNVYVASGLVAGDRIVLANSAFLNEKSTIKIVD